jgi:hypothetical protein
MANHANLLMTEDFQTLLEQRINGRLSDGVIFLDGVSPTNLPVGAKRWNATNKRFEAWNGTAWGAMVDKYAIDVDTVDGYHAGNGVGAIPINNSTVNATLNADLLDGYHAGNAASQLLVLDASALVPLANIPATLTGKNADQVDGYHAQIAAAASMVPVRNSAGALAVGGRPAKTGFTRIAPNYCMLTDPIAFDFLSSGSNNIVVSLADALGAATAVKLRVRLEAESGNAVGWRSAGVNVYSGGYIFLVDSVGNATREFVATPTTTILMTYHELIAPVTSDTIYLWSSGNLNQYAIIGYWD